MGIIRHFASRPRDGCRTRSLANHATRDSPTPARLGSGPDSPPPGEVRLVLPGTTQACSLIPITLKKIATSRCRLWNWITWPWPCCSAAQLSTEPAAAKSTRISLSQAMVSGTPGLKCASNGCSRGVASPSIWPLSCATGPVSKGAGTDDSPRSDAMKSLSAARGADPEDTPSLSEYPQRGDTQEGGETS